MRSLSQSARAAVCIPSPLGVRLLSPALFFVAGSWRVVLPHKSQKKFFWNLQIEAINPIPFNSWSHLFSGDQGTLDQAWKLFMEDLVPLVAIAPEGLQGNIIQGGGHWSAAGYGQGNLSRLIFDMSKVGVLSTRFDVYRDVILVALDLHWRLNSLPKVLDGDAKQAAFALRDALGAGALTPKLPWSVEEIELSESFNTFGKI